MALLKGDMRLALPAVVNDTENGGGPPSANLVPDGASNPMFLDIGEGARVTGKVELVHMHAVLRNLDTKPLIDGNVIISEPPEDPNVSVVLFKSPSTFARRPELVALAEATSSPGVEFGGYLLENHVATQRNVQIAQRPGADAPAVNQTLVLIKDEGLVTEAREYVRVRRVTLTQTTFTESTSSGYVDYPLQVAICETFSVLKLPFLGSSPNRYYAKQAGKTIVRRVNMSDSGNFYSATRMTAPVLATDLDVKLPGIYAQIVPNTRTETPLLAQRPGGVRLLSLVDSLGTLQVSASAHTTRLLINEGNQGYAHTFKLNPPPANGTISVSFVVQGVWQNIYDDGTGTLGGGAGTGNLLGLTGDLSVSLDALPDYNTFIIVTWASTLPYINRCPSGSVVITTRPPEFEVVIQDGAVANGALVAWESGGVARTATANAAGTLSGDATGRLVPSMGRMFIRPAFMPDAGSGFEITYASKPTTTESIPGLTVDAGGFAVIPTTFEPVPGTVRVRWVTARKVSATSGANLAGTSTTETSVPLSSAAASTGWAFSGADGRVRVRTTIANTNYSEKKESATSTTQVVAKEITDDGAGGFGDPALGVVNYAGKSISLRMVSQGATVTSYQSDQENAKSFYDSGATVSMG